MMSDYPGERRRYARIKIRLPGFVRVERPTRSHPIEVMDLSEGGSLVRDDEELAEGTEVRLTTEEGSTKARVVRSDADLPGFGMEFIKPDDRLRSYVRRLLAKRARARLRGSDDDNDPEGSEG
jgi:hypothetical protein